MDELGHRKRLRDKFYCTGLISLLEYERLELLLTYCIPRKDCKGMAKQLLKKFHSITGVFEASETALLSVEGVGIECVKFLKFLKALYLCEFSKSHTLYSLEPSEIVAFLRAKCDFSKENFYMLMLGSNNTLLNMVEITSEFKESVALDIKHLLKEALLYESYSVVIAHNHLIEPTPSREDVEFTKKFSKQLELVGIQLIDHIVFTREGFYSMKSGFEKGS